MVEFVQSQYSCILTSVCVSDKIINNSDNFRIKCLFFSKIRAILWVLYFLFYTYFLFNLGKHVNWCEKISFSLLYLTLVTSCIIDPFLCCHLLYLIIYLEAFLNMNKNDIFYQIKVSSVPLWIEHCDLSMEDHLTWRLQSLLEIIYM